MATAQGALSHQYEQSIWGSIDPALRNCLIAAGILGLIALIVIFVTPLPLPKPVSIDAVPERIARLILEKPKAVPAAKTPERVAAMPKPEAEPAPAKAEKATPRARALEPRAAPDRGAQGREKGRQEVAQNLASVTRNVDHVLASVAKSLPTAVAPSTGSAPDGARRRRAVRSGRDSAQLASVGGVSSGPADLTGSAIADEGIQITAITDIAGVDGGGTGTGTGQAGGQGTAASSSAYRSNESLLAVVRRYAPGIQFCYDNELKRNPTLRGKLVVAITVLADGRVSDATVVDDALHSAAITQCMLAQIRGWRFPAIAEGSTTFRAPFVFTPPN